MSPFKAYLLGIFTAFFIALTFFCVGCAAMYFTLIRMGLIK